jgi:hypothetical protein
MWIDVTQKLYLRCGWENFGTFHADTVRIVCYLMNITL